MIQEKKIGDVFRSVIGSALGATLGFVVLRALLTPVRIKIVTSILDPGAYGAVTLLSMTAHGLAMIVSLGGFETLLRRLPSSDTSERERIYGGVFVVSSIFGLFAALVIGFLWSRLSLFGEMADYVPVLSAVFLILMFLHIQQKIYWLLGCRRYWPARLLQLMWSDLWFIPLLLLIPAGLANAEGTAWAWAFWLAAVSLLTWKYVPVLKAVRAIVSKPLPLSFYLAGLPLLPVIMGEWIFRLSGHYVLMVQTGAAEMAFYALSLNIALVGLVAAGPLVDMCCVELSHVFSRPEKSGNLLPSKAERQILSKGLRHLYAVLLPAVLVMVFMPDEVVGFLAASSFMPAADFLPLASFMPVLLALNLLLARVLMLCNERFVVICGAVAAAVFAVLLCVLLVPVYGVYGALFGIIVSCAAVDIYYLFKLRIWRWLDARESGGVQIIAALVVLAPSFYFLAGLSVSALVKFVIAALISLAVIAGLRLLRPSDFLDIKGVRSDE